MRIESIAADDDDDGASRTPSPPQRQSPRRSSKSEQVAFPDAAPIHRSEEVEDLTAVFDDTDETVDAVDKKAMLARAHTVPAELIADALDVPLDEEEEPTTPAAFRDRQPSAPDRLDESDAPVATAEAADLVEKAVPDEGGDFVAPPEPTRSPSSDSAERLLAVSHSTGTAVRGCYPHDPLTCC